MKFLIIFNDKFSLFLIFMQAAPEKRPLSSNTFLVNSARTPPRPPTVSKATDCKENVNSLAQSDELEEKLRKCEEELQKTKEKLKDKLLKENKLLGKMQ